MSVHPHDGDRRDLSGPLSRLLESVASVDAPDEDLEGVDPTALPGQSDRRSNAGAGTAGTSEADDRDLAGTERDHAGTQRDQAGTERDQAGTERDLAGDQRSRDADQRDEAGSARDQAGSDRDDAGDKRNRAADERDEAANARNRAASQRDHAADERDLAAEYRDQAAEKFESTAGTAIPAEALYRLGQARRDATSDRMRASYDRRAAAGERGQTELDRDSALADRTAGASERGQSGHDRDTAQADRTAGANERGHSGLDRNTALADRTAGANERGEAELDRDSALADRGASASDRRVASVDSLTGTYLRGAGVTELARDMARASRSEQPLVVAFVDVDHLKEINDLRGHAAGDRMLIAVADTLKEKLRSYDLIIRYGGDEFVCAISGLDLAEAMERLALVNQALADRPEGGSVTLGFAELRPEDSLESLVARADAALYRTRQRQRQPTMTSVPTGQTRTHEATSHQRPTTQHDDQQRYEA
jgi:diguanylate cyclase (GGDEF)-like protein